MRKCVECNPTDIDSTNLLPWDSTEEGFGYPGTDGAYYFEVPAAGDPGNKSFTFTVYPGTGLPYTQIAFDADPYWPADSYNITDADGNIVSPDDWNELTGPADYSLNVDSADMPAGVFGGSLGAVRSEEPGGDGESSSVPVNVLIATYQIDLEIYPTRVNRGDSFLIKAARRVTNRVIVQGNDVSDRWDLFYQPIHDLTLAISDAPDTVQPVTIAKEFFVQGFCEVNCSIQGATGNVTQTLTLTDVDMAAGVGTDTDTVEVLGNELYVVDPEEPVSAVRGVDFIVTIGARDAVSEVADATYVPANKVDFITNASPEVLTPAFTDNTGWVAGRKAVTFQINGGEGSGYKEMLSLMQDNDANAYGTIAINLEDNPVPDSCPGIPPLLTTYQMNIGVGHLNFCSMAHVAPWNMTLTEDNPGQGLCAWTFVEQDFWGRVIYKLKLAGDIWTLSVTTDTCCWVTRANWSGNKTTGLIPVGNYGDLVLGYGVPGWGDGIFGSVTIT